MADLKLIIKDIKDYIDSLDILTHFGGLCYLKTDGNITYGVSTEDCCKGNLYGNNHHELSGFLHISTMGNRQLNAQINQSVAKLDLHVFVPHKLIGQDQKYYYVINTLFSLIQKKYWQKNSITFNGNNLNKYVDVEYGIISIEIPYFVGCDDLIINTNCDNC
jgi:hypothetical protein